MAGFGLHHWGEGDETFAREDGMGELEQIALIEQIGLDLLVIDQHPDLRRF